MKRVFAMCLIAVLLLSTLCGCSREGSGKKDRTDATISTEKQEKPSKATEPKHNHTVGTEYCAPTCTADGYTREYCTTCGASLSHVAHSALGHDYHETDYAEPQAGVEGYIQYTCAKCGDSYRTSLPAKQEPTGSKEWESNVLTKNPFEAFEIKPEKIRTVTFLDSTYSAPAKPWSMGKGASSRVLGWVEWNGGLADVYFAADGGINGELCTKELFSGMENLKEVAFNGAFHTDYATDMSEMFFECKELKYVDIEQLETGNVKNMYAMFSTCTSLEELDLSGFDTSKVTNMGCMFSACRSLEYVDVSTWDTGKVTNMEVMFRWCDVLQEPDLSGWSIRRVDNYSKFMNDGMRINGRPWEEFFR